MIIYVTQGHENGIGIEIFLKAFSLLSKEKKSLVRFIGYHDSINKTLANNNMPRSLLNDLIILEPNSKKGSQSLSTLLYAMNVCQSNDVLITMPTTKDQLQYEGINHLGHTEFFRYYFKNSSIPMSFIAPKEQVLLLSDHLPLREISKLTLDNVFNRVQVGIEGFKKVGINFDDVYLSGINPHSGEGGLLGNEDHLIINLKNKLAAIYSDIQFHGPISGDALHYKSQSRALLIFSYHDQGLSYFKSRNGLLGINTTFGLPYLRLSVDHGTAFDLYGKNCADFSSMIYLFDFVFRI